LLVTGYWLLVAGYWFAGCWFWLLVLVIGLLIFKEILYGNILNGHQQVTSIKQLATSNNVN